MALTILIEGRSGVGKTTYSQRFYEELRSSTEHPCQLIHADSIYPGWMGLEAGIDIIAHQVLGLPEERGQEDTQRRGYYEWNWYEDKYGEWVSVNPEAHLVIEGVGVLAPQIWEAAHYRSGTQVYTVELWAPEGERKDRALRRDPFFEEFWDSWKNQEERIWFRRKKAQMLLRTVGVMGAVGGA